MRNGDIGVIAAGNQPEGSIDIRRDVPDQRGYALDRAIPVQIDTLSMALLFSVRINWSSRTPTCAADPSALTNAATPSGLELTPKSKYLVRFHTRRSKDVQVIVPECNAKRA